jgi:hypothetical protein
MRKSCGTLSEGSGMEGGVNVGVDIMEDGIDVGVGVNVGGEAFFVTRLRAEICKGAGV